MKKIIYIHIKYQKNDDMRMPTQLFSKYEHLNEEGNYKTAYTIFKFISKN